MLVIEDTGKRSASKRIIYLCKCDCGNLKEVEGANLRKGDTKSCGCLKQDVLSTHKMSKEKLYRTWAAIVQRCNNPRNSNYKYYGLKGVAVCPEWLEFINFKNWALANGFEESLSIDRIDPRGNYEPINCRWVTREVQDNNKRDSIFVEIHGERLTLKQVSKKFNISYSMLQHRYKVGDRGEKLIEQPKRGIKRNGEMNRRKFQKLNNSVVEGVKWLVGNTDMLQSEIASVYGISQTMVSKIKLGSFHNDITPSRPEWWSDEENEKK